MKTLGLDIGDKTIGLAVSDEAGVISFPRRTYRRLSRREDERFISQLLKQENIRRVVYGLPYHLDGSIGPQAEKTLQFIRRLENRLRHDDELNQVELIAWDERLTSKQADQALIAQDMRRAERKQYIDALAASFILQNYLDRENRRQE